MESFMSMSSLDDDDLHLPDGEGGKPVAEQLDEHRDEPRHEDALPQSEEEEDYGRKVQKRINKLVYERGIAESRAAQERAERERIQQELEETKSRFSKVQETYDAETAESLKKRHAEVRARLKQAIEQADFDAQVELSDELADVRAQMRRAPQTERGAMPQARDDAGTQTARAPQPEGQGKREPKPQLSAEDQAWVNSNEKWYGKPGFEYQTHLAQVIGQKLIAEGYTPGEDFYDELDKRVEAVSPDVRDYRKAKARQEDEGRQETRRPRASAAGPVRGGDEGMPSRGKRLTRQDLESMARYGMDPNSPEHRKAWLNRDEPL
jgi:hypothetical protein